MSLNVFVTLTHSVLVIRV